MSKSEYSNNSEKEVVSVSKHGQATIPKRFRDKLGIDAPGKVLFREDENGDVVVEQVPSAADMEGFAARGDERTDVPATQLLREKRERDRAELETEASPEE